MPPRASHSSAAASPAKRRTHKLTTRRPSSKSIFVSSESVNSFYNTISSRSDEPGSSCDTSQPSTVALKRSVWNLARKNYARALEEESEADDLHVKFRASVLAIKAGTSKTSAASSIVARWLSAGVERKRAEEEEAKRRMEHQERTMLEEIEAANLEASSCPAEEEAYHKSDSMSILEYIKVVNRQLPEGRRDLLGKLVNDFKATEDSLEALLASLSQKLDDYGMLGNHIQNCSNDADAKMLQLKEQLEKTRGALRKALADAEQEAARMTLPSLDSSSPSAQAEIREERLRSYRTVVMLRQSEEELCTRPMKMLEKLADDVAQKVVMSGRAKPRFASIAKAVCTIATMTLKRSNGLGPSSSNARPPRRKSLLELVRGASFPARMSILARSKSPDSDRSSPGTSPRSPRSNVPANEGSSPRKDGISSGNAKIKLASARRLPAKGPDGIDAEYASHSDGEEEHQQELEEVEEERERREGEEEVREQEEGKDKEETNEKKLRLGTSEHGDGAQKRAANGQRSKRRACMHTAADVDHRESDDDLESFGGSSTSASLDGTDGNVDDEKDALRRRFFLDMMVPPTPGCWPVPGTARALRVRQAARNLRNEQHMLQLPPLQSRATTSAFGNLGSPRLEAVLQERRRLAMAHRPNAAMIQSPRVQLPELVERSPISSVRAVHVPFGMSYLNRVDTSVVANMTETGSLQGNGNSRKLRDPEPTAAFGNDVNTRRKQLHDRWKMCFVVVED
eukprot:TRINITY_DN24662_c0_g1_i1.p1 TRINITY_DN24662_c0_g1~~TRINITY_DN24662_c0_g1_i1.p1  ORF type:complete len:741 (+),score=99.12 TRINITY_DN24662_c0_g1_i1:95-2317(+)